MKKLITQAMLLIVLFSLTAARCAKDSDEESAGDEATIDNALDNPKEAAIADWDNFMAKAASLNAITKTNLNTLRLKADKAKAASRADLDAIYDTADYDFLIILDKLECRDADFRKELKNFGDDSALRNAAFEKEFISESTALNARLEKAIAD